MKSALQDKALQLAADSTPQYQEAVKQLLRGQKTGHMGTYAYINMSEEECEKIWHEAHKIRDYYIREEEISLLSKINKDLDLAFDQLVDIGPGGEASVISKALPLAKAIQAHEYISIDSSPSFSIHAADVAAREGFSSKAYVADFMESQLPLKVSNSLILIAGLTILNAATSEDISDPYKYIRQALANVRYGCDEGCSLLLAIDSNNDFSTLEAAYHHDGMWMLSCSILKNTPDIQIDLSNYAFSTRWDEQTKRYAFGLLSLQDQTVLVANDPIKISSHTRLEVMNTFKLPKQDFTGEAEKVGWSFERSWTETGRISYLLFKAQ